MAKRRKLTPKPASKSPTLQPSDQSSVPATTDTGESHGRGRISRTVQRLADSGVDFLLDNFWWGVVFAMTSAAVAVWVYIQSGRAVWLYPYLYFALGFLAAGLVLIAMYGLLFYLQARRQRALERLKSAKYFSGEKGYLDHAVDFERAQKEFQAHLAELGREITRSGESAFKIGRKLEAARDNNRAAHRVASQGAALLNRHAAKMEEALPKFEEITDLLIESTTGYIKWAPPASAGNKDQLVIARQVYESLIELTRGSVEGVQTYRNSSLEVKGISQDVNSAINRLVGVTEGNLAVLEKAENHWKNVVRIIDGKLKA